MKPAEIKLQVANAFHRIVRRELPDHLTEIDEINFNTGLCATHQFCDANMLMEEAFMVAVGREPRVDDEGDARLWNEAWAIAANVGFGNEWDTTAKSDTTPRLRELTEEIEFIIERAERAGIALDSGNVVDLIADNSGLCPQSLDEIRQALLNSKYGQRFLRATHRISEDAICEAAQHNDLDEACLALQSMYDIESGDGAAYCLGHLAENWAKLDVATRADSLRNWIRFECAI